MVRLSGFSASCRQRKWFWGHVVGHITGHECCRVWGTRSGLFHRNTSSRSSNGARTTATTPRRSAKRRRRPTMRSVAVKTVDQQAKGIIVKHREMLLGQRTQAINALRGHATEFGVVAAKGAAKVEPLLAVLMVDPAIPAAAREMFVQMGAHIEALESRIAVLDAARGTHLGRGQATASKARHMTAFEPIPNSVKPT